jgi:hypothetical protein
MSRQYCHVMSSHPGWHRPMLGSGICGLGKVWGTHLAPEEDGPDTVEELEGRDDVALDQHARTQRCRHPPPCAHGHLIEPLLKRKSSHDAVPAS